MTVTPLFEPRVESGADTFTNRLIGAGVSTQMHLRRRAEAAMAGESRARWVWLVLIGVMAIAAGAAFVYCRSRGFAGFTGDIEAVRGPGGIKIGIKIACE